MKTHLYKSLSANCHGFTLPELLIGMVITAITIAAAGSGFITLAQYSAKNDAEIDRRTELNRAVEFISDEIREASSVSTATPSGWIVPSGYTAVFYLTRPTAPTIVAYYTRGAAGTGWRNQMVVYRTTASNDAGQPLVDGLFSANPGCSGGSSTNGFQVVPATLVPSTPGTPPTLGTRQVTLCLLGYVPNSTNLQVKGQSGPRANPPSL